MTIFKWAALALAGMLVGGNALSQTVPAPQSAASRAAGLPVPQALTAAELAKIKTVLAPYQPAALSANDARTIKRSLRDAGFRRSRELDAALVSAGFSPEKMDALDPPPPRAPGAVSAPPPPPNK